MRLLSTTLGAAFFGLAAAQQIQDLWFVGTNAPDQNPPGLRYEPPTPPISFNQAAKVQDPVDVTLEIDDRTVFQRIRGLGGSLTDSSASTLLGLKKKNREKYNELMKVMFDASDANRQSAGLSFIRVPIGSSDFSPNLASNADTPNDNELKNFKLVAEQTGIIEVLSDIRALNPKVVIQALPWSPPAWMKINDEKRITDQLAKNPNAKMMGGKLDDKNLDVYARYLVKTVQELKAKNVTTTFLGLQNEPLFEEFTYPSTFIPAKQEAQLAAKVRTQLDAAGLKDVRISGYDHNWTKLQEYADSLRAEANVFDSYGAHCYEGDTPDQLKLAHSQPDKEILFTECTGTIGSQFGPDLNFHTEHLTVGAFNNFASTGAMWNIALDGKGEPRLPGTSSCSNGCRGIVTVNADGTFVLNQEYFALGMASKAIIAKDPNGPTAKRVQTRLTGNRGGDGTLVVGAYVTDRASPKDDLRISTVALNKDSKPVKAAINFRGQLALVTLKPGLTTLSFYVPQSGSINKRAIHRRRHANR